MKSFCIVALACVVACAADTYTSDADIDIDALVEDANKVQNILDCFTGKVECSAQAAALRDDFPDVLGTACSKCTPAQKHSTNKFLKAVKTHFPSKYEGLQNKFDAQNKLFPALLASVDSY